MRLPVLLAGLGVSVAIVGAALLLVRTTDPGSPGSAGAAENIETAPAFVPAPALAPDRPGPKGDMAKGPSLQGSHASGAETADAAASSPTADSQSAYVEKRTAELEDLAMQDDPASLRAILAELVNPDAQIRKAALDAAIQFGSRDAIPDLKIAADRTADVEEKKALLDAIEFLKLPSLTEVLQQRKLSNPNGVQPPTKPGLRPISTPVPKS